MEPIEIKQKLEDVTEAALMPDRRVKLPLQWSPLQEVRFMDSGGRRITRGNGIQPKKQVQVRRPNNDV